MNENRNEKMDGGALGAERREADTDAEQPPDPGSRGAEHQVTDVGEGIPTDPDLARKAERAEPSRQARRLEYDPADEER